jgi:hypothetical protein
VQAKREGNEDGAEEDDDPAIDEEAEKGVLAERGDEVADRVGDGIACALVSVGVAELGR